MSLPTDSKTRKEIPVYRGFVQYFPDAMGAVAQCSFICNEQHSPGQPMHWDKAKSTDELDALMRHMIDDVSHEQQDLFGMSRDAEGTLHAVKLAWRAMANLQRLADSGVDIYAKPPKEEEEFGPYWFLLKTEDRGLVEPI